MEAAELRKSLHRIIDQADERFLRMVSSLANEYDREDEIVAYRSGKSFTKAELHQELKDAETEIENGDYLTIGEFAKESGKWD